MVQLFWVQSSVVEQYLAQLSLLLLIDCPAAFHSIEQMVDFCLRSRTERKGIRLANSL